MVETCFPNQHESRPFSYGNKSIGCSCGAVEKRWRIHKIPLHPTDEIEKTSFKGARKRSEQYICFFHYRAGVVALSGLEVRRDFFFSGANIFLKKR